MEDGAILYLDGGLADRHKRGEGYIIFNQNVYDYEEMKVDNEKDMMGMIRQLMGGIVKEMRATKDHTRNEFLDVLIQADFTDAQIDALLLEIFGPGPDTSSCTIEWAMSKLIKSPNKLLKLHKELTSVIGQSKEVREFDLENLPYLHACIKEILRLHPPVTFLLPHRATMTCEVMNHTILKNSQILVNTYLIYRDPAVWENSSIFKTERFLNSTVDYHGNDFQYIPFGAGRRICPALNMASRVTKFILASLFHNFEWSLPDGILPSELDMKNAFVLLVFAKTVPLVVNVMRKWMTLPISTLCNTYLIVS
ncbi:hypothetical protein Scep_022232 [Stephania cephalantha]|uniref:Cytochrome P450 n=1 Tax=Stephania cephalantha TaxID=152367 RepID=A0AAP0HXJ8_9MAGN